MSSAPQARSSAAKPRTMEGVLLRSVLKSPTHSHANRRLAKDIVWSWVGAKWPRLMPSASSLERSHIDCTLPGRKLSVATSEDGATWTLEVAYDERDSSRTWTTKAVVADTGEVDLLAVQTTCFDVPATRVVAPPRVLGSWVQRLDLDDAGVPVQGEARVVEDEAQLRLFCDHLLLGARTLPVIALANKPGSRYYGIDPRGLAEAVRGLAHVACLPPEAVTAVRDQFGRHLAPVPGAVRIYMPGFSAGSGANDHPLIRNQPPADADGDATLDPGAFRRLVCRRLCALSVSAIPAQGLF